MQPRTPEEVAALVAKDPAVAADPDRGLAIASGQQHTAPVRPPRDFIRWARLQLRIPSRAPYVTGREAQGDILATLEGLTQKLRETRAWHGFWDGSAPKPEPQLTGIILSYLQDLEIKGIEVIPEAVTGSGRMDYLFLAPLADGSIARICCEFKLAHAPKLAHGLESQLPDYMASKSTDLGIFGIIDFGPPHTPVVQFSHGHSGEPNQDPLGFPLSMTAMTIGVPAIIVRAFPEKSPSA